MYVNPRIVTLAPSWGYQPNTQAHPDQFTMFDLETNYENARILDYIKSENMSSFEAEFTVYTNIVPSITVRVNVHIREPRFLRESPYAGPDMLSLEQNSLEFQNKFHLTLNNPYNKVRFPLTRRL